MKTKAAPTKTLIDLVKKEASKLKKFAKKKELQSLYFSRLDPNGIDRCIYGQMTGCCFSARAHELINKCASKVYIVDYCSEIYSGQLNGKPSFYGNFEGRKENFYSPIETFIAFPDNRDNGNNKRLIAYLKNKTKKLVLK